MDTKALRQKILDLAIRGKLVPQDPNDEPASVLLERIRAEKQQMVKDGKLKPKDIKNDTVIFKGDDNLHYEKFSDGTVKCIEDEIPFDVPDNWEWCRFGSYTLNRDNERKPVSSVQRKKVKKIYDYYGASGVIDQTDSFLFDEELLLIGEDGANLLARTKPIAFLAYGKYWVNNHAHCIDSIDKRLLEFICIYINAINLFQYITGSAQPKLNQDNMNRILIPIPPKTEQGKILERIKIILSNINDIDLLKGKLQSNIANAKSKILDLAIRGKLVPQDPNDEPASVLLERIRVEKEELIKQGKIKRDKKESVIFKGDDNSYYRTINSKTELLEIGYDYELPDGWEFITVGEYSKKVTDQVASGSFAALRENVKSLKTPDYAIMVKTADFSNGFTKNLTYTDKHGYEFLENSNLFGGELILNNIGSIGKVFIVPKLDHKMTLAPNSIMIRLNSEEYRDYLYYFFSSPLGYSALMSISSGAAVTKFNKTDLKNLVIPIPPLAEQKRIVDEIKKIFAVLDDIANQVA